MARIYPAQQISASQPRSASSPGSGSNESLGKAKVYQRPQGGLQSPRTLFILLLVLAAAMALAFLIF